MCSGTQHLTRTTTSLDGTVVSVLTSNHARFVGFVERRVGSRATAEDLVQAALGRALEKGVPAEDADGALNWFYRVLSNAVTDLYRTRDAERRALDHEERETGDRVVTAELRRSVCACMHDVLPKLKPEYAAIVQRVDLEERPVVEFARATGITANNAAVRLHRARAALRKGLESTCGSCAESGCLDCSCRAEPATIVYEAR